MKEYSRQQLVEDSKTRRISQRVLRNLRFSPESITDWEDRDFLPIMNKSQTEGLLVFEDDLFPFRLVKRKPGASGKTEPIICDICRTWRRGSASAVMTFVKSDRHTISYLVCADLDCSAHVRDKTEASALSRTQLREHITPEQRVSRLQERLREIVVGVRE